MSKYEYEVGKTTRKQRESYALDGELSRLGGGQPSKVARHYMNEYVNGNMELSDAKAAVIAKYKRV